MQVYSTDLAKLVSDQDMLNLTVIVKDHQDFSNAQATIPLAATVGSRENGTATISDFEVTDIETTEMTSLIQNYHTEAEAIDETIEAVTSSFVTVSSINAPLMITYSEAAQQSPNATADEIKKQGSTLADKGCLSGENGHFKLIHML